MAETTRTSVKDFGVEVIEQVRKVTWPDREQLQNSTAVILAFMVLIALVILGMDLAVRAVTGLIRSLFGA